MADLLWRPLTFWDEEQIAFIKNQEIMAMCKKNDDYMELDEEISELSSTISWKEDEIYELRDEIDRLEDEVKEKIAEQDEAKKIIMEKYPQFFQNNKIYSRQTKDEAQFFYVLIYEYSSWWIKEWQEKWQCAYCKKEHPNSIEDEHIKLKSNKFEWKYFCNGWNPRRQYGEDDDFHRKPSCLEWYEKEFYENNPEWDENSYYINEKSNYYIYKITEKSSWKCYVWQTRQEPFFRWWQHLQHSSSPFGLYLRTTKLDEWTFEVLEHFESSSNVLDILEIESGYIRKFDSINNGFNSVISKK